MKITIPSFPILTKELSNLCGIKCEDYVFSYMVNDSKQELTLKPISVAILHEIPTYNLIDERGEWDPAHFSATIKREIAINTPKFLFGSDGLAAHDSVLGVAVLIMSLSSNHRYAIPVLKFDSASSEINDSFEFCIPKNFYRDKIALRTVIYLYQNGNPQDDELNLANLPGTLLGTIDEIAVFIDGTGSLFPVKKESDPLKPLWRVECNWSDPFNDLFNEENVCVIFNQAHPNYGMLKIENGMNGSPFLADVIASSLQIIISKTIDSLGTAENLNNIDSAVPGSIIDAVHYFVSTFGWDASSPERLAETIRLDFDRRTGNDN